MKSPTKTLVAGIAVLATVGALAGCSAGGDEGAADGKTELRVATFPPGADAAAYEAFAAQEKQFEKEYPDIDIIGVEYEWEGPTFAVQLAGGSLPDVFTVPFTDSKTLLENGQLMDVTDAIDKLGYTDKFNPIILDGVTGADGKIYGFPRQAYAAALHYNRDLFEQAGLDPDNPPQTWEEIREAAKAIHDATGKTGYAQMAINNTGGWQLTSQTVARGGRTQTDNGDGTAESTIDNDATKAALQFLHDVKWEDGSFGSKVDLDWGTINQEFAAGNVGMYTSGSDIYTALVRDFGMDSSIYGMTVVPMEGDDPGTLGGGDIAVISPTVDEKTKAAAVTWIDWYYMQKLMDKDAAVLDAKTLNESGQAVGTPLLPVLSRELYDESQEWIADYINVPVDQMAPFSDRIWDQTPVGEPKVKTQEVYALLDTVVQKVLTDQNADIDALLAQAQTDAQSKLDE
ncbi:ABC transporter substrate-binding protein [Microbacterium saperdae]|uniref:ABC-type glycerol-3-phosphate transport system substrate-binding protein n=1 Tax=Microbacterium saperdae TaxID=69368 RepID=A0A543BCD2_9MICO|nr:extracellular solute-binding protein [Microbacterium saperdae]TQL82472.1 ABC-type glycerol-3-phosphate transport system substrate-binding protein [Microbacterium saperdae]GGM40156.1 sugar ABC transporter substrate-binding protein [Microbacterium saperdae]